MPSVKKKNGLSTPGQDEDQRRQHELPGQVGRVAHQHRADLLPAQDRHERRDAGDQDRRDHQPAVLLLAEREEGDQQDARADVENQPAGAGEPAARAIGATTLEALAREAGYPPRELRPPSRLKAK